MAILNNSNAISSGGYDINNSLRFRASASAYLTRTPASAGNQQKWTYSLWLKRGTLSTVQNLLVVGTNITSQQSTQFGLNNDNTIQFFDGLAGVSTSIIFDTTQVFRDPSAWYHIVLAVDTTQATSTNRVKIYVNGNQITAFTSSTYPTQNFNTLVNAASAHYIGRFSNVSTNYFDGYLAETYIIDGQQLTPSSFGETDTTTGSWKPKAYTGTYGTNGFYLKFSDIATTSGSNAGLGKDFSGNANYWTTNNISVTAGTTYDAMIDSPTLTSATVANYCTLNPVWLLSGSAPTITNGNLQVTSTSTGDSTIGGTIGMTGSGKYYAEFTAGTASIYGDVGVINITHPASTAIGNTATSYNYRSNGNKTNNSTQTAYGATYTTNDVIGVALDLDAGTLTFYKNNTSQGTAFTGISASNTYAFACGDELSSGSFIWTANFGQRPFSYTPPTGFVRLNTYNLPDSTIKKGNSYMDVLLYTGNGGTQTITGLNFQPTLVWGKSRSNAIGHNLFDQVRGGNRQLASEVTDAEVVRAGNAVVFNSNGITLDATYCNINNSSTTNVAWNWIGGGTGSSNTSGSITSTVSVNTTAGFSVVTYTGTGANATVGHGLGVAPKMVIVKNRTTAGDEWCVWHTSLTNATYYLYLNGTAAQAVDTTFWNSTAPSSTVISLGSNGRTNRSSSNMVCYAWAEIAGFSKFGSYTGNGSTDGPFTYTGFRPKFIMVKRTDSTGPWLIYDTARDIYNQSNTLLRANTSQAETASGEIDILSNGFKYRGSSTNADYVTNVSGATYIYMAFAENPFKNSLAR